MISISMPGMFANLVLPRLPGSKQAISFLLLMERMLLLGRMASIVRLLMEPNMELAAILLR